MVYRPRQTFLHIHPCQMQRKPDQEGTTMTALIRHMSVIWELPVMIFNIGRDLLAKIFSDRPEDEGRWLNG
jgi:hypothetical protein